MPGPWKPAPLPDGSYADASKPFSAQDLVNYIPEYAESAGTRSQFKLIGAPGLREYASFGAGPHRGARDVEGKLFVVSDTHLYQVHSDTEVAELGEIPGRSLVWMTHNQITSGNEVVIFTGSDGYIYNTVTQVFSKITDTGFPGGRCCDFIDQMIIGIDPQGRFLFNSDLANASAYNDIERYEAEASPDRLVCAVVSHNKIAAFGERTIDFFQASQSDEDIANHILFRVEQGATLEYGCASRHGVALLDSGIWFIGTDGGFYELRGYTATRVSTHPIEFALSKCDLSKAFLTTFEDRGHKIVYLTCVDGHTWGFDIATRKWHRRESKGMNRWRINTLFKWRPPGSKQAKWFGGSYRDGLIYQLDWDYMKEGCDEHTRTFRTGVLHDEGNRVSLSAVRVEYDSGSEESVCVDADPITPTTPSAVYVAVGDGGKIYVSAEPDFTWTLKDNPPPSPRDLLSVAYGTKFVTVGNGSAPSTNTVRTSTDGDDPWAVKDFPVWASSPSGGCYHEPAGLHVIVGGNGSADTDDGFILTSATGETGSWTQRTAPVGCGWLQRVRSGGGKVFACSLSGKVIWSTDCITWHLVSVGADQLLGVAYGDATYMAVGENGSVWTSPTCLDLTWTQVRTGPGTYAFLDVDYEPNAKFFAVANGNSGVRGAYRSADLGVTWTRENTTANLSFCYGHPDPDWGGAYVGAVGGLLSRHNDATWTTLSINAGFTPYALAIGFPP